MTRPRACGDMSAHGASESRGGGEGGLRASELTTKGLAMPASSASFPQESCLRSDQDGEHSAQKEVG